MNRKHTAQSAFFNLRILITLLLCAVAAGSLVSRPLLAFFRPEASTKDSQRTLTFAERVAYQRAIEEVYWRHRIWPKENPSPKPSLDAAMSQAQLESKVADYLRKSQALEDFWQRPITAEQLQAEVDRMAQHTRQPEVLRELFEALGNDPVVITECLARPALSERLITNWYTYDQRIHGELRQRAEAELRAHPTVDQLKQSSGVYTETEFVRNDSSENEHSRRAERGIKLGSFEWEETVQRLNAAFNKPDPAKASASGARQHVAAFKSADMSATSKRTAAAEYKALPLGKLSPLQEDETRYYVTAVIEKADNQLKLATITWLKEPLHSWLPKAERQVPVTMAAVSDHYTLRVISGYSNNSIPSVGCTVETWTPTELTNVPDPRSFPTAVWTGSEMIVWGGYPELNTGGRYNPSTDTWTTTSLSNAPDRRDGHTAIWTGSEMIVWGGYNDDFLSSGGRYKPDTDTWEA